MGPLCPVFAGWCRESGLRAILSTEEILSAKKLAPSGKKQNPSVYFSK